MARILMKHNILRKALKKINSNTQRGRIIRVIIIIVCIIIGAFIYYINSISPELIKNSNISRNSPSSVQPIMAEYYIAPNGIDTNPGTRQEPFATVERARDVIRSINKKMTGNIVVYLREGTYSILNTLIFDDRDSGDNNYNIFYKSYGNEKAVLSGGKRIGNWKTVDGKPYWKTEISSTNFRQLYIDGMSRHRSRSKDKVKGVKLYGKEGGQGIIVNGESIPKILNPKWTQIHFNIDWQDFYLPVTDIIPIEKSLSNSSECQFPTPICSILQKISNSSDAKRAIVIPQPYFREARYFSNKNKFDFDTPFYLENDLSLVDEPGEWYFNPDTSELFYLPLAGEKIDKIDTFIPYLFQLIKVEGPSIDRKVKNIHFEGLTFSHAGKWQNIDKEGWFTLQAQNIKRPEIPGGMTPSAVALNNAEDIIFENNIFQNLGLVGISLTNGVRKITILGNVIRDTGDSAITVGSIEHIASIDLAYASKLKPLETPIKTVHNEIKKRYNKNNILDVVPQDILIKNNLIYKAGQEFWGAPGIQTYWTTRLTIDHNEISDLPYTGLGVGWGWDFIQDPSTSRDNKITHNRIERVMQITRDGGGIYTLGDQSNSMISGNYISKSKNDFGGIYLDEGSSNFLVENNVVEDVVCPLFIHLPHRKKGPSNKLNNRLNNNWVNGFCTPWHQVAQKYRDTSVTNTHFTVSHLHSKEAQQVVNKSGLEEAFKELKKL